MRYLFFQLFLLCLFFFAACDEDGDTTTTATLALATQKLFHREFSGVPVDQGRDLIF